MRSKELELVRHFRTYQTRSIEKGYSPFVCFNDKVNLYTALGEDNFYLACYACSYKMHPSDALVDYIVKLVESWNNDSR